MKIKSRIEKKKIEQISVVEKIFYLDISSDEFYSDIEYHINDFVNLKFSEIVRKSIKQNEHVAVIISKKYEGSLVKRKTLWDSLKKINQIYEKEFIEFEKDDTFSLILFAGEKNLNNLFFEENWHIVIGTSELIKKIYLSNPFNYKFLKSSFLCNHCKIVEFNDLGMDGKILSIYEQEDFEE